MEAKLAREVKLLKAYVAILTLSWGVFALAAFAPHARKQRFGEIDVERINVVERDGQIKMVISNRERFPDPGNVVTGKYQKRAGLKSPGITFYNEKGDECGGLIYGSKEEPDGKYISGSLLALDKYNGDQVIGLQYEEGGGRRTAGLHVWDQPDVSPEERKNNYAAAQKLDPGAARDTLLQQAGAQQRIFIGRALNRAATLVLSDGNGRPRIRMVVAPGGEAKLEFLDASGKVLQSFPDSGIH